MSPSASSPLRRFAYRFLVAVINEENIVRLARIDILRVWGRASWRGAGGGIRRDCVFKYPGVYLDGNCSVDVEYIYMRIAAINYKLSECKKVHNYLIYGIIIADGYCVCSQTRYLQI